jgi:chemotaxis protein histidine kinase CheA
MEFLTFPIVALAAALVFLIGVTIYALTQRAALRSRDEQLVVARAQSYAMLELSQAGVLFLDREHKLMGEASAVAPELLGHTCATGTAFVQVIAELVDVKVRRETVAYLETLWKAEPTSIVDATANPLQRVHSGSRHLAIRFARLVVDGRVHHIIVSIERISAPRVVPHTIEVPVLDEETFAKRLAGETGVRPALTVPAADAAPAVPATAPPVLPMAALAPLPEITAPPLELPALPVEAGTVEQPAPSQPADPATPSPLTTGEFELGPLDVTGDSVPSTRMPGLTLPQPTHTPDFIPAFIAAAPPAEPAASPPTARATSASPGASSDSGQYLATTITSPELLKAQAEASAAAARAAAAAASSAPPAADTAAAAASPADQAATRAATQPAAPDPFSIIDPPDARLSGVLAEIVHVDAARLEQFLADAREKAGQLRAIIKLPAREPQAFREKLVLILELIRGIHARAARLPLASVGERAQRFEAALGELRDKPTLSGNDFLPLAVKLDDLLSHLAIQGEVVARLREWRLQNGAADVAPAEVTQRSATLTGTTIRQPLLGRGGIASSATTTVQQPAMPATKSARLSDLSAESLQEMAQFLSDMYLKRVSLVVVGLEDVPSHYRRPIEKILGQLIHNAIRHGIEAPAERATADKPEVGTVAVQFMRAGADGFQLSVQDDGRGLDHDKIRAEAVRQGVLTAAAAKDIDPRKLASFIFRPGFTTVGNDGARGIGMDVVRELVGKAGGRVGIATKPGEYTRFRITLPHEKKASDAAVA